MPRDFGGRGIGRRTHEDPPSPTGAAHIERTVAITEEGPRILTLL